VNTLIGKTLGRYQIIEEIGRGGMAIVYKAIHPRLKRHVAVKVLPPQVSLDNLFVTRFRQQMMATVPRQARDGR
jgi:serine/threonine protein kinase